MSHRSTRSQEDQAESSRADLFRTPPATRRRVKTKKFISRTPSTSDTEREQEQEEHKSPLSRFADKTPRPPQTSTMAKSAAQDEIKCLREQLAQAKATIINLNQLKANKIKLQQQENKRARQHELEIARMQLQIEQAKAANTMPAAINITQHEDKVASFKKEVAAKSLKTSFKLEGSTLLQRSSTWGSRAGREEYNNQQGWIKCGYCNSCRHEEHDCRLKNYTNQSKKWQTTYVSAIEYFKKKNEDKTASSTPKLSSTPAIPSTPTPMANPNVGYTPMASLTTTRNSTKDPIRPIPKAVEASTNILDPIQAIPKAVGAATKKKKDLNSLPSRAEVPKMRRGWSKKQSIVDPAVLLAWDLINSINQDKALSKDLNMWFCSFPASPNAKQWEAALEGG
jgi:hypothetical protein